MANEEHLAILRSGASKWNRWREADQDTCPDLTKANLSGAELSGANLTKTDLSEADLSRANLSGANLSVAHLRRADLSRAYLGLANLSGADLSGADLRKAILSGANLHGADLSKANLNETRLLVATLTNLDLSEVQSLETVSHHGRSSIGVDTLFRSEGKIPDVFLRGVGVPEELIRYLPSFIGKPWDFYSCFISYSHEDKAFARRLHDALQGRGIRCWLDEKQILPGHDISEEIDRGIKLWDKVLLCCSKVSLTASSWVDAELTRLLQKEARLTRERGKHVRALIPLTLDDYLLSEGCDYPKKADITSRHVEDFTGWEMDNGKFDAAFERVVKALAADGSGREPAPTPKV